MAKPGPKPAPNNVRALRGDRASRFNYSAPTAPEQPAELPDWLPDDVRVVWDRIAKQTTAMKVGPLEADRDAFTFLCVQGRLLERLAEVLVKAPTVVRDANGQPTANPLWPRYERAVHAWLRVACQFALTPSSRDATRLGIVLAVPDYDDLAGAPSR